MKPLDAIFEALGKSAFRRRFRLQDRELAYLQERSLPVVLEHARGFIEQRLAPAAPPNDGKQTPFRGHPVFVAQHATACCCRGCLRKWHGIPEGRELAAAEKDHIVLVLERWLAHGFSASDPKTQQRRRVTGID